MTENDATVALAPKLRSIVVPAYLWDTVKKSPTGIGTLLSFHNLRKVASMEDVAVYLCLNRVRSWAPRGMTPSIANVEMRDILDFSGANTQEVAYILEHMSKTEEIAVLARDRLEEAPSGLKSVAENILGLDISAGSAKEIPNSSPSSIFAQGLNKDSKIPYQFHTHGTNVFVVAGEGFFKYLEIATSSLEAGVFVKDFVRYCESIFPAHEVARHPLFKTYVERLV